MTVPLNEQNILERVANEARTEALVPLSKQERVELIKTAGGSEAKVPVAVGLFLGAVTSVSYVPSELTSVSERSFQIINKGSANTATTVVASGFLPTGSAFTANSIPLTAETTVHPGDILQFKSEGGKADPGGELTITISRVVKTGSGAIANEGTGFIGTVPAGA